MAEEKIDTICFMGTWLSIGTILAGFAMTVIKLRWKDDSKANRYATIALSSLSVLFGIGQVFNASTS